MSRIDSNLTDSSVVHRLCNVQAPAPAHRQCLQSGHHQGLRRDAEPRGKARDKPGTDTGEREPFLQASGDSKMIKAILEISSRKIDVVRRVDLQGPQGGGCW